MALTRRIGHGSELAVDPAAGSSFDTLGNIVSGWSGPAGDSDEIETTVLSDTFKTFAKGQRDGGEVSFQIAYDPEDGAAGSSQTLSDLFNGCDTATWQATFVSACAAGSVVETFSGWVKGLSITVDKTSLTVADVTIRVTGSPGFTGST
jgi:hypothetical protein